MILYKIPEVFPYTSISLISSKKCKKVISKTEKFLFFMIHAQSKWKIAATSIIFVMGLSTQ
jgi:hypothetical protein